MTWVSKLKETGSVFSYLSACGACFKLALCEISWGSAAVAIACGVPDSCKPRSRSFGHCAPGLLVPGRREGSERARPDLGHSKHRYCTVLTSIFDLPDVHCDISIWYLDKKYSLRGRPPIHSDEWKPWSRSFSAAQA